MTSAGDASFVSSSGTSRTASSPTAFSNPADTSTPPPTDSASSSTKAHGSTKAGAALSSGAGVTLGAPVSGTSGATLSAPSASSSSSSPTTSPTAAGTADSTGSELSRLRTELDTARAEISRLKAQLDSVETTNATLRSRGAGAGGSTVPSGTGAGVTSQAVVDLKGQEGVPVQVVAGIAFGVFVVTWWVVRTRSTNKAKDGFARNLTVPCLFLDRLFF